MRTAFLAVTVVVLTGFLAYAGDPVSIEEWDAYVRLPYQVDDPYKNDRALGLQGQEPIELKPLPGIKKIILCYYVPQGDKPDDWYKEKIGELAKAANMKWRKMGAAIAGDTRLESHGLRFPFKDGKLQIHYVPGKMTATQCQEHPQAAEGIARECRFSYEEQDVQLTLHRENYAFVIFAHKYSRKDSSGNFFWTPTVFPPERTVVFSGEMLAGEVVGTTTAQQMAYLGYPNPITITLSAQRLREILPTQTDLTTQMAATQIVIGAFSRYLAEAFGCVPDSYPHSIMHSREWINTKLHFGKRSDLALKPTYFPPPTAKVLQSWVQ